jgi:hypothetical protein
MVRNVNVIASARDRHSAQLFAELPDEITLRFVFTVDGYGLLIERENMEGDPIRFASFSWDYLEEVTG